MKPEFDYEKHFGRPAVRRGLIYCAPWCGANCTWAAFQEATKRADASPGETMYRELIGFTLALTLLTFSWAAGEILRGLTH